MSYQIIYNSKEMHVLKNTQKRKHRGLTVCIFTLVLLAILRFSGFGSELWMNLIPGDPTVTVSAFSNMTDALQNGQNITEAVFVFCETVIEGAQIG